MLYVAGMKTESEFADVYLDFIRKCGIRSAIRRDNAKSEMSQRVKDIHRDLIIVDQWIEPHSPWQNPAELNGIKYLKSHAQVLLDRTGATDNGSKKTKHDCNPWMVDKSSHYECLAKYLDDILIWSKDPMEVIKSLEKTYMLKSVGITEYYLGGNVEFLGEAWKNQRLVLALSAKTYIQNVIPKFKGLFSKEFKPIKTPMNKGYNPEVDDSVLCTEDDSAKYRSIIGLLLHLDNFLR
jgi:hypothetical protein